MQYFKDFPVIVYDLSKDDQKIFYLLRDITRNVRVRKEILRDITLYDEYDIKDGETPEIISEKIYGSPHYHWVVMLANESYNWIEDFPLSDRELINLIEQKYGSVAEAQEIIKYHVTDEGEIVYFNSATPDFNYNNINSYGNYKYPSEQQATPITAYQYEVNLNESKRRIKIISPRLLSTVVKNFRELI